MLTGGLRRAGLGGAVSAMRLVLGDADLIALGVDAFGIGRWQHCAHSVDLLLCGGGGVAVAVGDAGRRGATRVCITM